MEDDLYAEPKIKFAKTRVLFLLAGMYNFGLAVFFLMGNPIGADFSLVHFAVALLFVFGIMLCNIGLNPVKYKKLIPYAMLRNIAYLALAGWYFYQGKLPMAWKVPAVIDIIFLAIYLTLWVRLFWEDDDV
ncbi:MAG: hypothetical protein DELT_01568 [Desulfovibrio sp.]